MFSRASMVWCRRHRRRFGEDRTNEEETLRRNKFGEQLAALNQHVNTYLDTWKDRDLRTIEEDVDSFWPHSSFAKLSRAHFNAMTSAITEVAPRASQSPQARIGLIRLRDTAAGGKERWQVSGERESRFLALFVAAMTVGLTVLAANQTDIVKLSDLVTMIGVALLACSGVLGLAFWIVWWPAVNARAHVWKLLEHTAVRALEQYDRQMPIKTQSTTNRHDHRRLQLAMSALIGASIAIAFRGTVRN